WNITTDIEWITTLRARAGIASGNMLFYATGGVAFADVDSDIAVQCVGCTNDPHATGSSSEIQIGYALGGGLEWAPLNNVTVRAEYLYLNFGEEKHQYVGTA